VIQNVCGAICQRAKKFAETRISASSLRIEVEWAPVFQVSLGAQVLADIIEDEGQIVWRAGAPASLGYADLDTLVGAFKRFRLTRNNGPN
jgi:hypothetical protein